MTLTAEQSSNKAKYEAAPTAEIIDIIRTAMGQGCIRPCHVYDAVDELICRIQALENRPKRNCEVGTPEEQAERLHAYCKSHRCLYCSSGNGDECKFYRPGMKTDCKIEWANAPYKEGGAK